jgi:hypothetical protein
VPDSASGSRAAGVERVEGGEGAESAELSEEQARRLVLLAAAALVVFLFAAGIAAAAAHKDRASPSVDGGGGSSAGPAEVSTSTGPLPGTDLASYVAGRADALAKAKGEWAAVVSFTGYLNERDGRARLADVEVRALLVAPAGAAGEAVSGDLGEWAQKAKKDAQDEKANLKSMAASTEDKDFKDQFQADIARLDKLLAAVDAKGAIVFGAVVVGQAGDLKALGGADGVRLVDLIGRRVPAALTGVRGVRPDETVRAGTPANRPV